MGRLSGGVQRFGGRVVENGAHRHTKESGADGHFQHHLVVLWVDALESQHPRSSPTCRDSRRELPGGHSPGMERSIDENGF